MIDENSYWLISDKTIKSIQQKLDELIQYDSGQDEEVTEILKHIRMEMETGLHTCGVKPWDM